MGGGRRETHVDYTKEKRPWAYPLAVLIFALVLLSPILYYHAPQYYGSPDIQYVKAKVLSVSNGDLFGDPVTGRPNFHPPYYHLFLSLFTRLGVDIDILLFLVSVINVCALLVLAYFVLAVRFEKRTAFICALMLPFIIQYMGPDNIALATAFYFSIPFFLGGLFFYLQPEPSPWRPVATAVLWGCAFLISPVYVFLIGFTFAYESFVKRAYRRFAILTLVFLTTITPFFIQMHAVRVAGMADTSTFALWRGIPDGAWFKALGGSFLFPSDGNRRILPMIPAVIIVILGILGAVRKRSAGAFPLIAALAYLFTAYHFSLQYAIRVQFFLSIFLAAGAIEYLGWRKIKRVAAISLASVCIILGSYEHFVQTNEWIDNREAHLAEYQSFGAGFWANMGKYLTPGQYVVVTAATYRYFIMPYFPAHALVAYKSGDYYQINEALADSMGNDYNAMMASADIETIERYCRKYGMRTAVMHVRYEQKYPVFQTIAADWTLVYEDEYFRIYQWPDSAVQFNP
ncbi:MAG: hypothetical protein PHR28_11060 [candidate division Zixibacteria bacterium]|nr:hypothetical protein [candidate division Zixibacteria bacterium]